jgi:hypothetical protein
MRSPSPWVRPCVPFLLLFLAAFTLTAPNACAADLQAETVAAYDRYIQAAEARMARQDHLPQRFLYIESLPREEQREIWRSLKQGNVWLESLDTLDAAGHELGAPHGLITHWVGAAFFPHADIAQVLAVIQDYDHFKDTYAPEIVRSKLISRQDETFRAYLRVHKDTPWVNPTLNINLDTTFAMPDERHASARSASTRIAQVEDAGKPDEHEDSVGHDGGYMWRLNTYWRLEARADGVVAEWEAITLSRDIPFLFRWFIRPFVERLARSTIRDTLAATRKEVEKRARAPRPTP